MINKNCFDRTEKRLPPRDSCRTDGRRRSGIYIYRLAVRILWYIGIYVQWAHDVMRDKHHTRTAGKGGRGKSRARTAGGAAVGTGGWRVGKAIATNKPSPPPIDAPIFPLDNVYILVERVLCTYTRIYIYTLRYIYTLSNPPTPPDGGAGTLLRRDPPPPAREPLRANALLPRASKMEGDSR